MTEIWNAWCLFWGIADAAIIVGLLAVAAWSSMPKRNDKRSKLNKMDLVVAHENNGQVVRYNQHQGVRFSDAFKGLPLDAFEHDGGNVEDLLFLAQTWREQEAIKLDIAHAPDCAIALNARHECSCGQNPQISRDGGMETR